MNINFDDIDYEETNILDDFIGFETFYHFLDNNNILNQFVNYYYNYNYHYKNDNVNLNKFLKNNYKINYIKYAFGWSSNNNIVDMSLWMELHYKWVDFLKQ